MSKIVVLGSDDCETCDKIKAMLKLSKEDIEYVDISSDEGFERAKEMARNGLEVEKLAIPTCVVVYDDGNYSTCDEEDLFERLKKETGYVEE